MRIFALIPALAAFITVFAGATVPVDTSCGLEIGCGDVESYIALSDVPSIAGTPITHSGVIEVFDANDESLGYISKYLRSEGHSHYDPLLKNALVVTFATDQYSSGFDTKIDLTVTVCFDPFVASGSNSHPS